MLRKDAGGSWKPQERNPLHPHSPLLLPALRGRAWAPSPPAGRHPRPSLAAVRPKPKVPVMVTSLCRRFAEQAVFILFCVFAILLFSRDPKFIPGWASLFTPG